MRDAHFAWRRACQLDQHYRIERKVGIMRPTLVTNPGTDRDFGAFAEQQLDGDDLTVAEFQARIRVRYPRAVVHAREIAGEPTAIWYVYRDGRWTSAGK